MLVRRVHKNIWQNQVLNLKMYIFIFHFKNVLFTVFSHVGLPQHGEQTGGEITIKP